MDRPSRVRRPRWSYAIPWAGRVPALTPRQWSVLGLLGAAELFDQYDVGILGLALKQIQEGLAIPESQIGPVTAVARLGVLPAFALTVLADRLGRRRLLLATIVGLTLSTFATAFARDAAQFMALQFVARAFIYAETMLAVVVLAEELDAGGRGWGIGMLGALGALGHGLAAILFGFVDVLPYGWRALYAMGAAPLLLLAWFRRSLPETRRFEAHRAARRAAGGPRGVRGHLEPVRLLAGMYPGRMAALAAAIVPFEFVTMTATAFMAKHMQEAHGYPPGAVTAVFLVGGALAILGNVAAGSLSDRFGRRRVLAAGVALAGAGFGAFYNASSFWVPLAWVAGIFALTGVGVLFKALGSELFPTSYRSTASGMRAILGTLGGVAGLALEGGLYELVGSHAAAITWMLPVLLLPPLVVLATVPETAARELEHIAPEARGPAPGALRSERRPSDAGRGEER